ncbi:MAG: EamA family transporter RarD [Enterobacteriaceae bacterium]
MNTTSGVFLAIMAFFLWGITPLYYKLLPDASIGDVLAQRILWSLPLLFIARQFIAKRTPWRDVWRDKRSLFCCLAAGIVMGISWTTFTYAMTHEQVLAASLGYFINPLVSILLGMLFLHDQLSRAQRIAVILALAGVSYEIWSHGEIPTLALVMGCAFAFYGLIRKFIRYDIMTALTLEALWLVPGALLLQYWLVSSGHSALTDASLWTFVLYALTAPVTVIPLFFFAAAIKRTTLVVIGLAQYIEPSLQFILAVCLFSEPIDVSKAISFTLIWAGLCCCVYELLYRHWRYRTLSLS